jgi:flagellin
MGLRIQNNVEAFNAHRNLTTTSGQAAKAMEKLSSGYRINRASDDAAGLAISEKMRAQISGLGQAQRNAQDGVSLVQTAEGALTEVHSMLNRIRELKIQHSNGTLNTDDQTAIGNEITALACEVGDIGTQTKFNDKALFGASTSFSFVVGAAGTETISTEAVDLSSAAALTTSSTVGDIDAAIKSVSESRAKLGAVQNRLEHRLNNLAAYQ